VALALVAVAAPLGWFCAKGRAIAPQPRVQHALAIVPPGPALVVTLDLARLREQAAGRALLGRSLAGIGNGACESKLAEDVDELALAMPGDAAPERPNPDELALVGTGRFLGRDVASCAEARVSAAHGDPVRTTIGSFTSVRDRKKTGEVAARDGLLVVSDGLYLRELIDAADGTRAEGTPAERARDELHAELRRVVGAGAPIIATLALPPGWLARTLADPSADLSPLATIRSAAVRVNVDTGIDVAGVLACDGIDPCARLERFFGTARSDFSAASPDAAALFGRLALVRHDARIDFTAHLTPDDLQPIAAAAPSATAEPRPAAPSASASAP